LLEHFGTLAAAYALAFPIALDRERHARSAGLRTFPLVAIAACAFILGSSPLAEPDGASRVVQGVVMGIGYIGGGAILKQDGSVHGTSTAASLWATGAIGVVCGLGSFDVAAVVAVVTVGTLRWLRPLKAGDDAGKPSH
jgi:putative Mg2+ transporter-C (MgtC) family protein